MANDVTINDLKKEDTILGIVLNSLFDGVYITNRDRQILFWNVGAENITAYSSEEVIGKQCADNILNHIDENGNLLCNHHCPITEVLATGKNVKAKVYPMHKSGKRFPVMTYVAPIKDANGEIIAIIEVFRDISLEENYRVVLEKFNKLVKKYLSNATIEEINKQVNNSIEDNSELKDLTILYLDIAGFTEYSEKSSPTEVLEMLNELFGMCDVITKKWNGDIDKFIGDAVMAVFLDANDAVAAGKDILKSLKYFNKKRSMENKPIINVRIGINSGKVIQGEVGTSDRKDLTVIGDVVNTASRIQSVADINTVAVSDTSYARLTDHAGLKYSRDISVKGKQDPIRVFCYIPFE